MKKYIPPVFVLIVTFFTWSRLSGLSLRGDSFIYFLHRYHDIYLNHTFWVRLANFDWSALLFGKVLETFFGPHLSPYGWVEVIVLCATVAIFYWTILKVTKESLIAFSASLIMGVSYYGNWDTYAGGIYLVFLERVPLMLFLLPSFVYLHLFLEQKNKKYYLYSLIFFFLGVGIGHWGAFFSAPFILYPFLWEWFKSKKIKLSRAILQGLAYFGISLFFVVLQNIFHPGLVPDWSFSGFILHPEIYDYPLNIVRQFVYWTTYLPFIDTLARGLITNPITKFVIPETSLVYTPYIVVTYLVAFGITYFKLPKFRALLITVLISIVSILFFNTYFGQYHIATQAGSSRYLNLPTYLFAIFWSLFLWSVFWQKKNARSIFGHIILSVVVIVNIWLVSENFKMTSQVHAETKRVWDVALTLGNQLLEESSVVIPDKQTGPYEKEFLNDQFRDRKVTFFLESEMLENKIPTSKNIYQIVYGNGCTCANWKRL